MKIKLRMCIGAAAFLAFFAGLSWALDVPEDAQRHMVRGQMAVEMARSPEDYALAVREFRDAARLAPNWPDPHFNLGLVLEKSHRYKEAVASLKEYLRLAPTAPDAASVRTLVYRLEFMAEQGVAEDDILTILASVLDGNRWKLVPASPSDDFNIGNFLVAMGREGEDLLITYRSRHDRQQSMRVRPVGKVLEFRMIYFLCERSVQRDECPEVFKYRFEVISKNRVKVNVKAHFPSIANQVQAYTSDYALEYVSRETR